MHLWLQDVRYAFRVLRKNLVLTSVMLASLAIGIGANTAIFSMVDGLLLRPLPYPHPERLAAVWLHSPAIGILRDWPSPGQYIDIQNQNHSFEQMALAQGGASTLTGRDQPERVDVLRTQSSLLTMFGAKALLGRTLLPEEDRPGKPRVAILSDRVWRRLFHADPAIIVSELHAVDPTVVVYGIRTMQDRVYESLARQRFSSTMLGSFAAFALLLAAVGLYGVMSYLVTQSTHDIGILLALGARPGNIIGLVVKQGMQLTLIGILVGLTGAAALTRVIARLLFGVGTMDVATFLAVPALLVAVAFTATVIPAWRATGVDPMVALREE